MSSKLFAFQVASPVEAAKSDAAAAYDPQSQTLVWQGEANAQATYCTGQLQDGGFTSCTVYNGICYRDDPYGSVAYMYECDG